MHIVQYHVPGSLAGYGRHPLIKTSCNHMTVLTTKSFETNCGYYLSFLVGYTTCLIICQQFGCSCNNSFWETDCSCYLNSIRKWRVAWQDLKRHDHAIFLIAHCAHMQIPSSWNIFQFVEMSRKDTGDLSFHQRGGYSPG